MPTAFGAIRSGPSVGKCERLSRELSGELDVGNLQFPFDERRAGRAIRVALSLALPFEGLRKSSGRSPSPTTLPPRLDRLILE
jgi:hypothetical protein